MHKTLHKKLTEKHLYEYRPIIAGHNNGDMPQGSAGWLKEGFEQEMSLLREAAKDLLQPRPEAVAKLLAMAKTL